MQRTSKHPSELGSDVQHVHLAAAHHHSDQGVVVGPGALPRKNTVIRIIMFGKRGLSCCLSAHTELQAAAIITEQVVRVQLRCVLVAPHGLSLLGKRLRYKQINNLFLSSRAKQSGGETVAEK